MLPCVSGITGDTLLMVSYHKVQTVLQYVQDSRTHNRSQFNLVEEKH